MILMGKKLDYYQMIQRIAGIIGLMNLAAPFLIWERIPERIPSHFNEAGVIDNWSGKSTLIFIIFIIFILTVSMYFAAYYLKTSALSEHATEAEKYNLQYVYPMVTVAHLLMQLVFAYITFCSITCRNLGRWFMPVVLIVTFGLTGYYIFRHLKNQKTQSRNAEYKSEKLKFKKLCQEQEKKETGECYRSKIDWWLGLILGGTFLWIVYLGIDEFLVHGTVSISLLLTLAVMLLIYIPLFRIRYILYSDHLTLVCFIKYRIPYRKITGIKETHNPLSSAALSLDRLQVDYINKYGQHDMILISPVRKQDFIRKVEEKRQSYI